MSSSQSGASAELAKFSAQYAQKGYDVGFQGLRAQQGLLRSAEAEPGYVQNAFAAQRAGITEGGLLQGSRDVQAQMAAQQGAAQGGNTAGNLSADQLGAKMAQALYGSRVQEGLGRIEQANKLMGMQLGQSVDAGNQALGAAGNELRNISMMPNYNPTYANVLGGLNIAGSIYGGLANRPGPTPMEWGLQGSAPWDAGQKAAYGGGGFGTGNAGWFGGGG